MGLSESISTVEIKEHIGVMINDLNDGEYRVEKMYDDILSKYPETPLIIVDYWNYLIDGNSDLNLFVPPPEPGGPASTTQPGDGQAPLASPL